MDKFITTQLTIGMIPQIPQILNPKIFQPNLANQIIKIQINQIDQLITQLQANLPNWLNVKPNFF